MDFIRRMDPILLLSALGLAGIGIVMVYSASFPVGAERMGDPYHFLKKQAFAAALGIGLMLLAARLNYRLWKILAIPLLIGSGVLLCLVFVPGVRQQIGGAYRWLKIYSFSFQPAELAKLALVIYLARSLTNKEGRMDSFAVGFLPHVIVMGILFLLVLRQPDFGTGVLFVAVVFLMLFVAGARLRFLGGALLAALPVLVYLAVRKNYRWERIVAFWDPWKDPGGGGFQIIQSFLAFGAGKIFGVGLGEGKQKLFYLPEIHTDFIFSVVGEELGLIGVTLIIALFAVLILRGFQSSYRAPDLFGTYLSLGITSLIAIQALLNMGVVTGLLPTKGSTLPFVSYGGTSLMINLMAVGILLNVHSQGMHSPGGHSQGGRSRNEDTDRRGGNGRAPLPGPGRG
jgi:cell division protein FtsW